MSGGAGDGARLAAAILLVQLASLRSLDRYVAGLGSWRTPLGAALVGVVVFLLVRGRERVREVLPAPLVRISRSSAPILVLGVVLTVASVLVYPHADGLKLVGRGSDQDDALIQGAWGLVTALDPYRSPTYLGNELSPGPGWILLTAPFTLTGLYPLLVPAALVLFYWTLRRSGCDEDVTLAGAVVLLSGLGTWEALVVGGDMLPLGIGLVVALRALRAEQRDRWAPIAVAVPLGLLLTGRAILALMLPLAVAHVWRRRGPRDALWLAGVTSAVLGLVHGAFALREGPYMPAHVLDKGWRLVGELGGAGPLAPLLLGLPGLAAGWLLLRWAGSGRFEGLVGATAVAFTLPLGAVATVDLARRGFDLSWWEGAHYLLVAVPLWVYYYALAPARIGADRQA